MSLYRLPQPLLDPLASASALDAPFWQAATQSQLVVQRCALCLSWRWSPEWICPQCYSSEFSFDEVEPTAVLESWTRIWHPAHPSHMETVPYIVVLVTLPQAGNIRMMGNYAGLAFDDLAIGSAMEAVFTQHTLLGDAKSDHADFSLVQWRLLVD